MRRTLRKITALLTCAVLAASLSACGEITGLDAQALMSPPRTTADRQAIYTLMCGEESDVTLIYPKNGDYRSAIISRDLNGDGVAEVAGFCANGAWYSLAQFTSAATQVDRVFFGDLTGDGTEEVVVGWGDPQTATASVSVYSIESGSVRELSMNAVTYSEMLLTDFDGDSVQELFVLSTAQTVTGEETVTAPLGRLYRFDGEQPYVALTVPLDSAVTRYSGALFTQINTARSAVVLDGVKADGRMVTELPTAALVMEPAEGGTADSTAYTVTWNTYSLSDNTLTPVCSSIINTAENYIVVLPESESLLACANDSVTRTSTFFRYERMGAGPIGREDLFSITVYSEEAWAERGEEEKEDEIYLNSMGGRIYVLTVLAPSLSEDSALIRAVCEDFQILNE